MRQRRSATDYRRVMAQIEARTDGLGRKVWPRPERLVVLVESLQASVLSEIRGEAVQALRAGIRAMRNGGWKAVKR